MKVACIQIDERKIQNYIQSLKNKVGENFINFKDFFKKWKNSIQHCTRRRDCHPKIKTNTGKKHLKLSTQQQEILNQPYAMNEISAASSKQKFMKYPGNYGISAEYYRKFEEILILHFKKLLDKIHQEKMILNIWKKAVITIIHKEDTDPEEIQKYRPISF